MISITPDRKVCRILTFSALILLSYTMAWAQHGTYERFSKVLVSSSHNTEDQPIFLPLSYNYHHIVTDAPNHGSIAPAISVGSSALEVVVDYTPDQGFVGLDTAVIEVRVGGPPVVLADIYYLQFVFQVVPSLITTEEDYIRFDLGSGTQYLQLDTNDFSTASGLTLDRIVASVGGVVSYQGDSVLFTPHADYHGRGYLTYIVCDSTNTCASEVANFYMNDSTVASGADTIHLVTAVGSQLSEFLPASNYSLSSGPQSGSLDFLTEADAFVYTAGGNPGYDQFEYTNGTHTILYKIHTLSKATNSFVFDDYAAVTRGDRVGIGVFENDRTDNFSINNFTQPSSGSLQYVGNGRFEYISDTTFSGLATFTYEVCALQNCETGQVHITVSDFAPSEEIDVHHLTGIRNREILINYDVPVNDYEFEIVTPATNGIVEIHAGLDTISHGCVQSIGRFMISYTPDSGFEGLDNFTLSYCNAGECTNVEVNVEIIDVVIYDSCRCQDQCVWPGDFNFDGRVGMLDLLTLGNGVGSVGLSRSYPDPDNWYGQFGDNWENVLRPEHMANEKHCDADGDGAITVDDTLSLESFYGKHHTIIPKKEVRVKPYAIGLEHDLINPPDSGDTITLYIAIGTPSLPAENLTGVSMDISFDPATVDTSYTRISAIRESWLVRESMPLFMNRNDKVNFELGLTRIDREGKYGYGRVFAVDIIIDDDLDGIRQAADRIPIHMYARNIYGLDAEGREFVIPDQALTAYVETDEEESEFTSNEFLVYPNPVQGRLTFDLRPESILEIQIVDMQGRVVFMQSKSGQNLSNTCSTTGWTPGIYMIRIQTTEGVKTSRFLKTR